MFIDVIKDIYTTQIYNDFKSEVLSIDEIPSKSEDVDWYGISLRIFNDIGDSRIFHEKFYIPKTSRGESTFGGRRQTGIYSAQLIKAVRVYRDEVSWSRFHCQLHDNSVIISTQEYEKHGYQFLSFLKYFDLYDKYSYWFLPKYLKAYTDETYELEKEALIKDIEEHEIPENAIKKLRLWMKNPELPNKLTKEVVEIIMYLIDNYETYIDLHTPLDFVFMDVYAGLENELKRDKFKLRRYYSFKFNKYNKVFVTDLQNTINHYFNMRDADIRNLQSPIDTNALSVTTQSDKIYFVTRKMQSGELEQIKMYTKYFVGFIDPIKTAEGGKVNIKNEISRDAKIDDGKITITVYNKNFEEVELDPYTYLSSTILTSDHIDYITKTIHPINGSYDVFQYGEYREIPESQENQIDYYRKQDSILTRSTSMLPFINKTQATRGLLGAHF